LLFSPGHQPRWIASHRRTSRNAPGHDCPHTNSGSTANDKRHATATLPKHGAGTHKDMVLDYNISVAHDARRESHVIAYHTVMLNVTIQIGVEVLADTHVRCQGDKGRQNRADPDDHIVHLDHTWGPHVEKTHAIGLAPIRKQFPLAPIGNREHHSSAGGRVGQKVVIGNAILSIHYRRNGPVINEHQFAG